MNRKSVLKWALVFSLITVLAVPYSVFSAGPEADNRQAAVERIQGLKIINGRPDGSLGLNESITRAELVTIIVRAFGQEANAKLLPDGPSSFPDVTGWQVGYVAIAQKLIEHNGEKLGLPDGTFNPNGKVTAAEAVAFLMKFLGVKPDASLPWPNNYINQAVKANLITADDAKSVKNGINTAATRGLVFYLADSGFSGYKLDNGKTVYTTFIDKSAPTLAVDPAPKETDQKSIVVTGTATGADSVRIGNNTVKVGAGGKWSGKLAMSADSDTYEIVASDLAGNTASTQLTIIFTGVLDDVYGEEM